MKRIAALALLLATVPLLAGCIIEHQGRAVSTQTTTQNPDGTTTVTRTEVIREPAYSPVYVSPWWGWGYYPYYYYRPYPYYYGGYPYHHHHH